VDVYVPGCPPRPETLIEGVMAIQRLVEQDGVRDATQRGKGYRVVVEPVYTLTTLADTARLRE
jgi:NADH-quinone oxidoreductase subunit B